MKFWLTTHYPHPRPDTLPWHVYLQERFEHVGRRLTVGDKVLIFELKHHKPAKNETLAFPMGREGIVAAATASGTIRARPAAESFYELTDGTTVNWKWEMPTADVDHAGFVGRADVYRLLNFKAGYTMRGFGSEGSGIKRLTESQYSELLDLFRGGGQRGHFSNRSLVGGS
jgi:hypothetical protein